MRKFFEHKTRSFKAAEDFDKRFWQRAGVQARFSAMWKCVEDFYRLRGKRGYKLRLQRSVEHIKQI
jgi:hypothetical protein